ncbi:MAG: TonB-dependent receptor plug domain-containing protein [Sphingomonas sp.]
MDLRGLGSLRTLTLVNGRRFVSGIATANSVDTSAIPTDLIERLEVTTGGASAVYGSDAVAGVVNFVLKKDFEGLQLRAQAGITEEGDGAKYKLSATWGTQFAGGRGHLTLFASGDRTEPIKRVDREYSDHLVRLADSTKPGEVTTGVSLYPQHQPLWRVLPPRWGPRRPPPGAWCCPTDGLGLRRGARFAGHPAVRQFAHRRPPLHRRPPRQLRPLRPHQPLLRGEHGVLRGLVGAGAADLHHQHHRIERDQRQRGGRRHRRHHPQEQSVSSRRRSSRWCRRRAPISAGRASSRTSWA